MTRNQEWYASRHEVSIPFQGFYNTIHDAVFDMALEQANTSDRDSDEPAIEIGNVDWREVRLGYAQKYLADITGPLGINADFSRIISLEDYSRGNDRIIAWVPREDIRKVHQTISEDPEALSRWRSHVAEILRPREGFIPYFPADVGKWGALEDWDDAQIDCLFAFAGQEASIDETEIAMGHVEAVEEMIWRAVIDPDKVPGHVDNSQTMHDL